MPYSDALGMTSAEWDTFKKVRENPRSATNSLRVVAAALCATKSANAKKIAAYLRRVIKCIERDF